MPNGHKLGVYLAPHHDPALWERYLRDIDPPLVRVLLPGDAPADLVSRIHQAAPGAEISLRWWDIDDGGESNKRSKYVDPHAHAERDMEVYHERITEMERVARNNGLPFPARGRLWVNTPNEPPTWEHAMRPAIAANCARMVSLSQIYDLNVLALELAVGHPEEWPPTWEWAAEVIRQVAKHKGSVALHEYWQPEGPLYEWTDEEGKRRQDWGALCGRYLHLPHNVRIDITETGVDGRIFGRFPTPQTGYKAFMEPDHFAGQTATYLAKVKQDKRIRSVLPFLTDYQDVQWESFDTLPAREKLVEVLHAMDKDEADNEQLDTHLPLASSPVAAPAAPAVPGGPLIVDPVVAKAILNVESGGAGYADGALKIRFEAHIFERHIAKNIFDTHFRYDSNDILRAYCRDFIAADWVPIHQSQRHEWRALLIAQEINARAALLSTSMGSAQIMGFNHARVGFATPEAMFEAFSKDETYHLIGFFNYLLSDPKMYDAIRAKDWRSIARLYNGAGLVDLYSARLLKEYKRLGGVT